MDPSPTPAWHSKASSHPGACVTGGGEGSSAGGSTAQGVHHLLASIPQDLLAKAAAQCGAHARALLHYETHLRSTQGAGLNPVARKNTYYSDDEVSFLQVVPAPLTATGWWKLLLLLTLAQLHALHAAQVSKLG